jgi:fermentation-respiration switch protein FrsA (DUF1100 family)
MNGHTMIPRRVIGLGIPIGVALLCAAPLLASRTPEGIWVGTLEGMLRIVVHVRATGPSLTGSMDSPDQGAMGLPMDTLAFDRDTLRFVMRAIRGDFAGVMNAQGDEIAGRWHQGSVTLPLTLRKTEKEPQRHRPQEPQRPYPYAEDTVRVENRAAGVSLAGTLTTPRGVGPFPAVVLVTGSGPEDRDETVFGHRPFLVLADHLTRAGIVVLRLDDRGVGSSSGSFSAATTQDFASDAEAAVGFLRVRKGIDPGMIGLIGHSEGGLVVPMVAARSKEVAFIVLLAGPGVRGDSLLGLQVERLTRAAGADEAAVQAEVRFNRSLLAAFEQGGDSAAVAARIHQLMRDRLTELPAEARARLGDPDSLAESQLARLRTPWMRFFLSYDPAAALRRVRCPLLALNGERDVQVPPRENLKAIGDALRAGGNRDFETKELPVLNHLFQTATTGSISEYARIEETMSPTALDEIAQWLARHTKR